MELKLLYQGSVHGDRADDFYAKCDKKGPNISFIKSSLGKRFGGFTSLDWDCSGTFKTNDPTAFIFSLDYKTKYNIYDQRDVIFCGSTYNVSFGNNDFKVRDSFCNLTSSSNFPNSYGMKYDKTSYFTGGNNFTVEEVEVYSVI